MVENGGHQFRQKEVADGVDSKHTATAQVKLDARQVKKTLALLALIQFGEGWLGTVVMPILPYMVNGFPRNMALSESEQKSVNGDRVGMIGAGFFLASTLFSSIWGMLSDRFGRRPTLLIGSAGSAIGILVFGCCQDFYPAFLAYFLTGMFSSNISVTKSYLAEITDENTQARAFSLVCLMYSLASIMGPSAAGFLGGTESFLGIHDLPYAFVISFVSACFAGVVFCVGFLYLPESPAFIRGRDASSVELSSLSPAVQARKKPSAATNDNVRRDIFTTISNYGLLALVEISLTLLVPFLCESSRDHSGLGLTSRTLGMILAFQGGVSVMYQAFIFPKLAKFITPISFFKYASIAMVLTVPLPYLATFCSNNVGAIAILSLSLGLRIIPETTAYTSSMILIANASPAHMRGLINGVANTVASLGRTIGPYLTGKTWGRVSVIGAGWIPFVSLSIGAAFLFVLSMRLSPNLNLPYEPVWQASDDEIDEQP
uniref:Major facilitator superfamily (MFS) profile domain-containing protein n=1 Tax=Spongospora subterranea TaxID=70186 RepID=A0A0H5QRP9_9EUKA|eukprot:CRZ04695.1 hypothetical protein [Spongospora subterranea]